MSEILKVKVKDKWYSVEVLSLDTSPVRVLVDGESVEVDIENLAPSETEGASNDAISVPPIETHIIRAPMPGAILSVTVKEGDQVNVGDEICILEAMKMQQSLKSDASGKVLAIHVQRGQQVLGGASIVELA